MDKANTAGAPQEGNERSAKRYSLNLEEATPLDPAEAKRYANALKAYFLSGKDEGEKPGPDGFPLSLVPYRDADQPHTDFPVYYDAENDDFISFYRLLDQLLAEHMNEASLPIIRKALPTMLETARKNAATEDIGLLAQPLVEEIITSIQALELPETEPEGQKKALDALQRDLLKQVSILFGFGPKTTFQILNLQVVQRGHLRAEFLRTLNKAITGLQELLALHGDAADFSVTEMDFAEDLISFDKISNLAPSTVSSQLPDASVKRIRAALQTLSDARESYAKRHLTIIARAEVIESLRLRRLFSEAHVEVASADPCQQAIARSRAEVECFVQTIAALRLAELIIEQKFDEDLHHAYFDHFHVANLASTDIAFLPTTLVVEHAPHLASQCPDFLSLFAQNRFVNVLAYTQLDDLYGLNPQEEADWLELAALAICRRNSYVFQGGLERPSALNRAFQQGLAVPESVLWHILIPAAESEDGEADLPGLKAAVDSRFFPRIATESEGDANQSGPRIDLQQNPDPDTRVIIREQRVKTASGEATIASGISVAACLAMAPKRRQDLKVIPPGYRNPDLMPLHAYLSKSKDELAGKIPFLWLVDEARQLRRAAIPFAWVQGCRNRLAYWDFLQSLAGTHRGRLQAAIDEEKAAWEEAKKAEIASITSSLRSRYENERDAYLEQAILRMVYGLLGEDGGIEGALTKINQTDNNRQPPASFVAEPEKTHEPDQTPVPAEPAREKAPPAPVIAEAWVESEDCTSCQDCVDALPAVFKYNENKQAYVHNPQGGTFAQIVKAAEKCPARCIHPGVPQNKEEPSLDKWMKRAEKFN